MVERTRIARSRSTILLTPPLATPFGDIGVSMLGSRASALSLLGNLETALADANQALNNAHDIGHAATLIWRLTTPCSFTLRRGDYAMANLLLDELIALADEKRTSAWKWQERRGGVYCLP